MSDGGFFVSRSGLPAQNDEKGQNGGDKVFDIGDPSIVRQGSRLRVTTLIRDCKLQRKY